MEFTNKVNHPDYYVGYNKKGERIEVEDLICRMIYHQADVFKYLIRAPRKGQRISDLEKALRELNACRETYLAVEVMLTQENTNQIRDWAWFLKNELGEERLASALLHLIAAFSITEHISREGYAKAFALISEDLEHCKKVLAVLHPNRNDLPEGWEENAG